MHISVRYNAMYGALVDREREEEEEMGRETRATGERERGGEGGRDGRRAY